MTIKTTPFSYPWVSLPHQHMNLALANAEALPEAFELEEENKNIKS